MVTLHDSLSIALFYGLNVCVCDANAEQTDALSAQYKERNIHMISTTKLSRRQWLKGVLALSTGAVGYSVLNPVYADDEMVVKGPAVPDIAPVKVSERCYVIIAKDPEPTPENQGLFSNMGFILTEKGVVVFDTGGSVQIGEMLIRQIKKITDKPVVKIFNSHEHGDHWLGNHAFVAEWPEVEIYGHQKLFEALKEGVGEFWLGLQSRSTENATAGTILTPPNKELVGGETFDMGDTELRVHFHGRCHTASDISLEVVADKTVYVGDVLMAGRLANMDDGSYIGSISGIKHLITDTQATNYVQGHYDFGPNQAQIYLEFLETLYNAVSELQQEGLSAEGMKDQVIEQLKAYHDWKGFDTTVGRYIALAHTEAEENNF